MTNRTKGNGASAPTATEAPAARQSPPTHGAIRMSALAALLKYFKESPMPHDVSNPFVEALSCAQLMALPEPPPE